MVVDTSAVLAVLLNEDDGLTYKQEFARELRKYMSSFNALEADIVITARFGVKGKELLDRFMFHSGIEIIPFSGGMTELAYEAWKRYGKSRHKAGLNMGDCCSYALARELNKPLLYKGGDFSLTDIEPVV